ncbi:Pex19p Ecym_3269 [Eremothecium cymbalariae DBVPG|uniref:Peroxin-19 n=1 Tax=Eremothecium cymbalariae (strain CBS 270.75 / DBVPG 7215 / KCTC 17166 / NRRL Y-17582) TaxID=931890 RepID=G8JRJ3_ERECY|nr:Hypothetical protein Ecym_3269 [Eremothecium cymbalariae DBVPG\
MSSPADEYDDLDEYLEDPSKLDREEKSRTGSISSKDDSIKKPANDSAGARKEQNTDPEVAEMIEELQSQFQGLMTSEVEEADKEAVNSFKNLLGVLEKASVPHSPPEGQVNNDKKAEKPTSENKEDFKDIISNTLDRLKENSTNIDSKLEQEKKSQNSDEILSQLFSQLADGSDGLDGDNMDGAILNILNQMSSKEVMYQPMKEMQIEFVKWMEENSSKDEHKDKISTYNKQLDTVNKIIAVYEKADYSNEKYRNEITDLIDALEQLGDSPVNKGFNSGKSNQELNDFAKMLEVEGDENLGNIDKELENTCNTQ